MYFKTLQTRPCNILKPLQEYVLANSPALKWNDQFQQFANQWQEARSYIAMSQTINVNNTMELIERYKVCYKAVQQIREFQRLSQSKVSLAIEFTWESFFVEKDFQTFTDINLEQLYLQFNLSILLFTQGSFECNCLQLDYLPYKVLMLISEPRKNKLPFFRVAFQHLEDALEISKDRDINALLFYLEACSSQILASNLKLLYSQQQVGNVKLQEKIKFLIVQSNQYEKSIKFLNKTISIQENVNVNLEQTLREDIKRLGLMSNYCKSVAYYQYAMLLDPTKEMGNILGCLNRSKELQEGITFDLIVLYKEFIQECLQHRTAVEEAIKQNQHKNQQIYKVTPNVSPQFPFELPVPKLDSIQSQNTNQINIFVLQFEQYQEEINRLEEIKSSIQVFSIIKPTEPIDDMQYRVKQALEISEMDKLHLSRNQGTLLETVEELEIVDHESKLSSIVYCKSDKTDKPKLGQIQSDPYYVLQSPLSALKESINLVQSAILSNRSSILSSRFNLPKMMGTLQKESPHWLQGYQTRLCTLENKIFKYIIPADQHKYPGILNFDVQSYMFTIQTNKQGTILSFTFQPIGSQKLFRFKSNTQSINHQWINAIQTNLLASQGVNQELKSLTQYPRFWRTERFTSEQFADQVSSGDLMLFRGKDINCQLQRMFTGAEYDHVGLILRFGEKIYLFEATGLYGVGLCAWDSFIENKWYKLYEKLVFRKLEFEKDNAFLSCLETFVRDNIGKKFACNPKKLVQSHSTINDKQNKQKDRTYFCSELVAKAFKVVGLLPIEPASSKYWPSDFSQSRKPPLPLLKGSKLSFEYLIDFG